MQCSSCSLHTSDISKRCFCHYFILKSIKTNWHEKKSVFSYLDFKWGKIRGVIHFSVNWDSRSQHCCIIPSSSWHRDLSNSLSLKPSILWLQHRNYLEERFRKQYFYLWPHSATIKHHFQCCAEITDGIMCKQDSKLWSPISILAFKRHRNTDTHAIIRTWLCQAVKGKVVFKLLSDRCMTAVRMFIYLRCLIFQLSSS